MSGSLPPDLQGTLFRAGPAQPWGSGGAGGAGVGGVGGESDIDELAGALHAVEFRDGRAVSYVRQESAADAAVLWHGGSVLALPEAGIPSQYTRFLEPEEFTGGLTVPIASHVHRLAADGGACCSPWTTGRLTAARSTTARASSCASANGTPPVRCGPHGLWSWNERPGSTTSRSPRNTWCSWSRRLLDWRTITVVPPRCLTGGCPEPKPGSVCCRVSGGGGDDGPGDGSATSAVRWIRLDPSLVTHVLGAYDAPDGTIVMYVCCYGVPELGQPVDLSMSVVGAAGVGLSGIGGTLGVLERWRIVADGMERVQVDERSVEYPRMDPRLEGAAFRYGYSLETAWAAVPPASGPSAGVAEAAPVGLLKFDLARDEIASWSPGAGCTPSEPLFVRAIDGHGDDEGWLLTVVDDLNRGASDIYVLDASALGRARPEAVIHLPARVPVRSHGEWVQADRYR